MFKTDGPKSAKQYVYDLLVAEYLFNHNYAYTLSVFASEAPLLINFSNKTVQTSGEASKEKLRSDYILHALETLGINPHDAKGRYVMSQYIENDAPLLFSRLEKLSVLKRKISAHKQAVSSKLHEREMMLKEQAVLVEQQLGTLNTKLKEVQRVMEAMSLKEKQVREKKQNSEQEILQKEIELTLKERLLLQEEKRLQREQSNYRKLEEDLKELQEQKKVSTSQTVRSVEVQTDFTSDMLQEEKIKALTKEKEELSTVVSDQQLKIEQITQRALQLSRQIEGLRSLRPISVEVPTQTPNVNTIISESSSTEDILQDAKLRLKRLEEESLKADQYYYNFINNSPC